jgi:hypothetical protein
MQTNLPPEQLRNLMQQLDGNAPKVAPPPPAVVRIDGCARAVLTGIDMPFWSMVRLMIKIGLAAVPAAIILYLIGLVVGGILTALGFGALALGR